MLWGGVNALIGVALESICQNLLNCTLKYVYIVDKFCLRVDLKTHLRKQEENFFDLLLG